MNEPASRAFRDECGGWPGFAGQQKRTAHSGGRSVGRAEEQYNHPAGGGQAGLSDHRVQPAKFTVNDVRAYLRRFGVFDGLQCINRLSRWLTCEMPTPGISGAAIRPGLTVTQWDLAFAAKQLILCS